MGEINLSQGQQNAIAAIKIDELKSLTDHAIRYENLGNLHHLPLESCGSYVENRLHHFKQVLMRHSQAKTHLKRTETENALRKAARDLSHAVEAMKQRMETEQNDAQFFSIDDHIIPPPHFSKHLTVTVTYRWRQTVDAEWRFGSIMFIHEADDRPDYRTPSPKRKPSMAKQKQELQDRPHQTWEHMKNGALYSVRDFFKDGGDGDKIPHTYQTTVGSRGELNNYSTKFWRSKIENHPS